MTPEGDAGARHADHPAHAARTVPAPQQGALKQLECMSRLEATTLVLLVCVAAPLKHILDWPIASRLLGPIHGLVFLAYVWTVLQTVSMGGWSVREGVRLIAVACIPFAGFFNIAWLRRKARALSIATAGSAR